jgi:hypothetical protein
MENINMYHKETEWDGMDSIHFVQETEKWWAVLNMVIKFGLHQMQRIS